MPSSTSPTTACPPFPVAELYNIDYAQAEACAMALAENADIVIGVKVRMSENVICQARARAAEARHPGLRDGGLPAKMMCHIGGVETKELMSQILDLLRPGDILTHCLFRAPKSPALHQHRAGRQAAAGGARR